MNLARIRDLLMTRRLELNRKANENDVFCVWVVCRNAAGTVTTPGFAVTGDSV